MGEEEEENGLRGAARHTVTLQLQLHPPQLRLHLEGLGELVLRELREGRGEAARRSPTRSSDSVKAASPRKGVSRERCTQEEHSAVCMLESVTGFTSCAATAVSSAASQHRDVQPRRKSE